MALLASVITIVNGPNLPQNIQMTSQNLLQLVKLVVMPVDRPVVVVADTTSKAISLSVRFSAFASQIDTNSIPKKMIKR